MSTVTRTLGLNAAFLQEIKEDNSHLRELLDATADALSGPLLVRARPQVLAELLGRLRDQLAMHFSLEEFFGYFEDAVDAAPHLSANADVLRAQHETLFVALCSIVDDAEKLVYGEMSKGTLRRISSRFGKFYEDLRQHEASENELVMQALYEDIGVGD